MRKRAKGKERTRGESASQTQAKEDWEQRKWELLRRNMGERWGFGKGVKHREIWGKEAFSFLDTVLVPKWKKEKAKERRKVRNLGGKNREKSSKKDSPGDKKSRGVWGAKKKAQTHRLPAMG